MKNMENKNDYLKELKEEKKLMRLNRFLAKKSNCCIVLVLETFMIILMINYFVNFFENVKFLLQEMSETSWLIHLKFLFVPNLNYIPIYFIGIIVALILGGLTIYKIKISYQDLNVDQRGASRWTTLDELKQQYKSIPEKYAPFAGKGGFLVSRYEDQLFIDDSAVNNLIIGSTRSGKGETLILPMLDEYSRAAEKSSLVIADPKLELYAASKETLERRGFLVLILNLIDCLKGMQYNPLQLIIEAYKRGDYSEAELLCNTFATSLFPMEKATGQEQFWNLNAINLLCALILALVEDCLAEKNEEKINMYSLINMFQEMIQIKDEDGQYMLDYYFKARPERNRAKMKYATIGAAPAKTKGGIFSTMTQNLTLFTYEEIAKMTSENTINLLDIGFGEKPIALFLGVPDYDKSRHFLVPTFISQLNFVLSKQASKSPGGKCTREVVFMLDEFGNMPAIPDFNNIITVCLGRNIKFNLIIQSLSQLSEKYGDKTAATIRGNCGNIMYILTSDFDTAKSISDLLGNETITNVNRSGKKLALNKSYTEEYISKPLLDPNRLMNEMAEGYNVVHRSLKRKDLKSRDIRSYPIFNTGETRFKYRYQYLQDDFPTNKTVDMLIPGPLFDVDLSQCVYYPSIYRQTQKQMCKQWGAISNVLKNYWTQEKIDSLTLYEMQSAILNDELIPQEIKEKLIHYLVA